MHALHWPVSVRVKTEISFNGHVFTFLEKKNTARASGRLNDYPPPLHDESAILYEERSNSTQSYRVKSKISRISTNRALRLTHLLIKGLLMLTLFGAVHQGAVFQRRLYSNKTEGTTLPTTSWKPSAQSHQQQRGVIMTMSRNIHYYRR